MFALYTNELLFLFSLVCIAASLVIARYISTAALMSLIALQVVLMNVFVTKQIMLFGLHATSTDALGIGAVLGINLLREYGDALTAKKSIIISFMAVFFYTLMSLVHLGYIPSAYDVQHAHFVAILQPMPRIMIASLVSYIIIQSLEYWLYGVVKRLCKGRYFIARNYAVVLFTQLLDTVFFTFLALYGIVDHIDEIIIISYAIKVITIICMTPLLVILKSIISRIMRVTL